MGGGKEGCVQEEVRRGVGEGGERECICLATYIIYSSCVPDPTVQLVRKGLVQGVIDFHLSPCRLAIRSSNEIAGKQSYDSVLVLNCKKLRELVTMFNWLHNRHAKKEFRCFGSLLVLIML